VIPLSARDELVVLVDERNQVVGSAPRWQMRAERLLHRSTYILVFNRDGKLWVQKRTLTKDIYPGYWDPATGGVVLAGESYEEGARRELAEEMGIGGVPLSRHFDFYYEDDASRVWGAVFSCRWDGEITPQAEEVERVELMTVEEISRRAQQEPFTPDGLAVVQRWLEAGAH
jgi:isopentenyldiphosphate isomerase